MSLRISVTARLSELTESSTGASMYKWKGVSMSTRLWAHSCFELENLDFKEAV